MIRPPHFSEVAARHRTRFNAYARWLDHYLPHYRWCGAVLDCSDWKDESQAALSEYFPDAEVVSVRRLTDLPLFTLDHPTHFSVVVVSVASHIRTGIVDALKPVVRSGGLLVSEGAAEGLTTETHAGITISHWLNV